MSQNKFLKCACAHCGGHMEFPADGLGSMIPCPHCGAETELVLEVPPELATRPSRGLMWFIIGAVILLLGVIAAVAILIAAQRMMKKAGEQRRSQRVVAVNNLARVTPKPVSVSPIIFTNGFSCAAVVIEKTAGSTLVYATGSLKNETDRQRFGVTVEIDLLDPSGTKLGTTKDYITVIEPRAVWKFRASIAPKNVVTARVVGAVEQL